MKKLSEMNLKNGMYWHLVYNHYPPYPAVMVETCINAVEAARAGEPEKEIELPEGYITKEGKRSMTASAIIEDHHLSDFMETAGGEQ